MIQNGTVTIQNTQSGEHRTFKVFTVRKGGLKGKRIVSLLTGSDNEADYAGFGFVSKDGISVWKKKASPAFNYYAKLVVAAFAGIEFEVEDETVSALMVMAGREYSATLEKRCLCCNRKLTTPKSLKVGVGPECASKLGVEW